MNTGASGALDPDSKRAQDHADRYYESIRKRNSDVANIARNTGFAIDDVQAIKNHVFIDKHKFDDGRFERFFESYEQAESWQRLENGTYTDDDIVFMQHELLESKYMSEGDVYEVAHEKTNRDHNWEELIK